VQVEEGKGLADEYGVQFFETSALTGSNVEGMFTSLATTIKRRRIDEYEGSQAAASAAAGGGAASVGGASRGAAASQTVDLGKNAGGDSTTGSAKSCC